MALAFEKNGTLDKSSFIEVGAQKYFQLHSRIFHPEPWRSVVFERLVFPLLRSSWSQCFPCSAALSRHHLLCKRSSSHLPLPTLQLATFCHQAVTSNYIVNKVLDLFSHCELSCSNARSLWKPRMNDTLHVTAGKCLIFVEGITDFVIAGSFASATKHGKDL